MRKTLVLVALAVAVVVVTLALYRGENPFLQQVDLRLKDARFLLRGAVRPAPEVAVVAIDNASVREIGRWPWSREVTARLIELLHRQGAKVVALDMVFSEPQGEAADRALARALQRSPNLVLGFFFRNEVQQVESAALEQTKGARVKLVRVEPEAGVPPVTGYGGVEPNIPSLGANARSFGFFNQIPDNDGLFRKTPLLLKYREDFYPSLGLTALSRYLGREIGVEVAPFGIRSVALGELSLPVNEGGSFSLNYYGPTGSFTTVSAADLLKGRVADGLLRDKIVFIGATETGIYDMRATPFDPALPGVEIHATLAANVLQHRFMLRDGNTLALELGCLCLLPVVLALLLAAVPRTVAGLGFFGLLIGGYGVFNYLMFARYSIDLSIVFPLLPIGGTYVAAEAYRNLVIEKRGRYLRKAFASYLSPELVAEIVKNPDRLQLGGERREVSVLFCDIRGFTTLSEELSPEDLVRLLNRYLTPMTRIVLKERGFLDKFIGDAIMAFYNAPLDVPEHAGHACRSALKMLEQLQELNAEFESQGLPKLGIGVGINTGAAVVGNMGADTRFDYTAIGDTVNLASRIEGLNRLYGTSLLVSECTRKQAGDGFFFREIDLVRVKGKREPVAVYQLLPSPSEWEADFAGALRLYRRGEFAAASSLFSGIAANGCDDPVVLLYLERCREFGEAPPTGEWDGIYLALRK